MSMSGSTILVTGGCGFIGTALIQRLRAFYPGIHIRVLDSLLTGTLNDLAAVAPVVEGMAEVGLNSNAVRLVVGDIRDFELVRQAISGCNAVVHLAANTGVGPSVDDPRLDMDVNVGGTFNVLEAARLEGVRRLVFASSGAPAGEVEPPIHEEIAPHPVSPYGASKLAGEGYCSAYWRTFGLETVCLRFGNVYGPGSGHKSSVVAKFIRKALAGETCHIFGDGLQTRDFIFIDDLVEAIRLGLEKDVAGETFQVACGMERTVGEVAELISTALAQKGIEMCIEHEAARLGDVLRNYSDTRKAQRMLGWMPSTVLEEGIARTVDYFLSSRIGA
ncbi:NAD-dependent epimerase/dehydratase family protein [Stutzerimonas balearica]|uniref:NAD-dependent epimerase/dehydratase family protein n=1 Tax=Stutzerimonas balearica TaxID=74829 RepID=UPI0028A9C29E|nr:NAD-dependent epimerase/dehydratase family protein [Stutzerimonas balearica]